MTVNEPQDLGPIREPKDPFVIKKKPVKEQTGRFKLLTAKDMSAFFKGIATRLQKFGSNLKKLITDKEEFVCTLKFIFYKNPKAGEVFKRTLKTDLSVLPGSLQQSINDDVTKDKVYRIFKSLEKTVDDVTNLLLEIEAEKESEKSKVGTASAKLYYISLYEAKVQKSEKEMNKLDEEIDKSNLNEMLESAKKKLQEVKKVIVEEGLEKIKAEVAAWESKEIQEPERGSNLIKFYNRFVDEENKIDDDISHLKDNLENLNAYELRERISELYGSLYRMEVNYKACFGDEEYENKLKSEKKSLGNNCAEAKKAYLDHKNELNKLLSRGPIKEHLNEEYKRYNELDMQDTYTYVDLLRERERYLQNVKKIIERYGGKELFKITEKKQKEYEKLQMELDIVNEKRSNYISDLKAHSYFLEKEKTIERDYEEAEVEYNNLKEKGSGLEERYDEMVSGFDEAVSKKNSDNFFMSCRKLEKLIFILRIEVLTLKIVQKKQTKEDSFKDARELFKQLQRYELLIHEAEEEKVFSERIKKHNEADKIYLSTKGKITQLNSELE